VSVNGFVRAAIGAGIREYAKIAMTPINRFGKTSRGSRMSRASRVEKHIVPKRVVVAWLKAAVTITRDVGAGITFLWKYHCETTAAVVALWIPLITERVQMYVKTKYTPNHQLVVSMINFVRDEERWPPRNTLVNIPSHIQVQTTTASNVPNPSASKPGFAAKILEANSKIPIAFVTEWRPL